ncbi:MAG: FG-GAP repeat domain-containing protein, partial [Blastococcus sp.]
ASYPLAGTPISVAIGDVDADRRPDLVVADGNGTISVLLGVGAGAFAPRVDTPTGVELIAIRTSVTVVDLNQDGRLDLVIGSFTHIDVMWGNGSASFAPPRTVYGDPNGMAPPRFGDVNTDGRPDLVTTKVYPIAAVVLLNLGSRTFATPTVYESNYYTESAALGDLTGDGKLDIATSTSASGFDLLVGAGNGTFGPATFHPLGDTVSTITIADLDGDGHQDVLMFRNTGILYVAHGFGGGSFAPEISYTFGMPPQVVAGSAMGDIDGDHRPDIIGITSGASGAISVLLAAP